MKQIVSLLFGMLVLCTTSLALSIPVAEHLEIETAYAFAGFFSVGVVTNLVMPHNVLANVIAYGDLVGPDGTAENPGGSEQIIYFSPVSDFTTIQAGPAFSAVTGPADACMITTDHEFATGKRFYKLTLNIRSGKITGESVGEVGGKSVLTKFEGLVIDSIMELAGMQRLANADKYIILAPLADGNVIQIGTEKKPATMSFNFDSAGQTEGVRGSIVEVEASDVGMWIYTGAILLTPQA